MATIRQIRIRKGISIEQLSEMTGISRIDIKKWERGEEIPPDDKLAKIAYALKVGVQEISFEDEEVNPQENLFLFRVKSKKEALEKLKKLYIDATEREVMIIFRVRQKAW